MGMQEGTATMAELLRTQGYSTHAIGKWHLGYSEWDYTPTGRGFDSHTGYLQGAIDYYTHEAGTTLLTTAGPKLAGFDFWKNRDVFQGTNGTYNVNYYEAAHKTILDNHDAEQPDSKPLFIYYAHESVHEPLQVPPVERGAVEPCAHVNMTEARNTLCQMMVVLDGSIGEFVEDLKAKDLWENTVMWVTTDNGGMTAFQTGGAASASSNYPLRAGKVSLFEGGVRGVSFVTGGLVPKAARGSTRNDLMHAVDIVPSLVPLGQNAGEAGVDLSNVDGQDMWKVITEGARSPRDELPLNINPHCDLCTVTTPLATNSSNSSMLPIVPSYSALIEGDMKLIVGDSGPLYDGWWSNGDYLWEHASKSDTKAKLHLYNLTADESERHNLAKEQPEILAHMLERLKFHSSRDNGFLEPQHNLPHFKALPRLHDGVWAPWVHAK